MKKVLQLIRPFREMRNIVALCLVMVMTMGVAWGQTRAEVLAYTLDGTQIGGTNGYDNESDITQNNISWKVTGNTTMNPWRIGGKNISAVDRPLYSTTPISDNISKIEVTHGTASNITVNSWTLIVASDASFTNVVSTLTPTFTAEATTTINRPAGADWSNCYYKFVYNVSVSGTANRFVQFTQAQFYKQEGSGPVIATPTFSPVGGNYITAQNVTISCETQDAVIYYTTDGSTPDNTSTEYTGAITVSSTTTINAIAYVDNDASSVASATYTIVQPLSTMQAIFDKATEVGNTATNVYITLDDWVVSGVSTNGKNVFVTDGTKGLVIFDNGGNMGFTAGDVLSGTVYCKVHLYNGSAELTQLNSTTSGLSITTGGTVTAADVAMSDLAGVNTGALVHYENLTCSINNNKYYLSDGTTTLQVYNALYDFGTTLVADHIYNITGVYQQYTTNNGETKEVLPRSADDIEEVISADPSVTVTPTTIDAPYGGANGTLALTYENITDFNSFDYYFCDANGGRLNVDPDWIYAEINEENDTYSLDYTIYANDGAARTAYIKVYTYDDNEEEVYAIVTVNQAQYVVDYATLPFEFDSTYDEIANTYGLTEAGLGNYANAPHLKFDGNGDSLLLHFIEAPGILTFDLKAYPGNNGWAGTFDVQTSEDGESYTNLATYTNISTEGQSEQFNTLGENVRYIKWIYTEKVSGNVGLGNIKLAQLSTEPVITLTPSSIEAPVEGVVGALTMTTLNMSDESNFEVQFFEEDGETFTSYDWVTVNISGDSVEYTIAANEGEARTAYMKVYGFDPENDGAEALSNLVTITQAAAPQQYTLTISEIENLEIFTFVDDDNELALEGAGTIMVTEGAAVSLSVSADEGYILRSLVVDGQSVLSQLDATGLYTFVMPSHAVTVTATAELDIPGEWVLTSIEDLTENDVFVIVGTKNDGNSYAMSNDNGTGAAPTAVSVTVVDNTLSGTVPSNIQWNISFSEEGFTFYPNGNTDNWLYSTNTNNGVRVGVNDANVFTIDSTSGYIKHVATSRYLGVYLAQDWRTYTTIHANIEDETFAFYKKVASTTPTQTIALSNGTNWVSFYVETNLDDLKAALVAAVPGTDIKIQDQNNNTKYNPNNGRWSGRLNTLDVAYMYMITVASDCEITLEGSPINPADHPVEIKNGATWIGFPLTENMTPANAFAGFAVAGDKVQSQSNNASYNGTRWSGRLTTLEPGKGYIYHSQSEMRVLTFPGVARR